MAGRGSIRPLRMAAPGSRQLPRLHAVGGALMDAKDVIDFAGMVIGILCVCLLAAAIGG